MSAAVKPEAELERAQADVGLAKRRLASTMGALQYRLRPDTLMNNALEGVREKGTAAADNAMQAVKERPMTASGIVAALFIFLARDPLWRMILRLFSGPRDEGVVKADLAHHDKEYDLAAPVVSRSLNEGVNA